MSTMWLRLWHDMPTDPKFRTIARISKQSISLVLSVYLHLLVSASRNVTRGHATVTAEDIASALDVTEDEINAVLCAMEGRVLDGFYLSGWEARQPKREDSGCDETGAKSATERKREQRERAKLAEEQTRLNESHDLSRNVTLDKEEDKDKEKSKPKSKAVGALASRLPADWKPDDSQIEFCKTERKDLDPALVAARFVDFWIAQPGAKGRKLDWAATWRNWVRNEKQVKASAPLTPVQSKPWFLSQSGIEQQAASLGIQLQDGEVFPYFKQRVYQAAGVTAEMLRGAQADFGARA